MDLITPPSARTDAPLIAAASGLQTKATTFAISSGSIKRFKSDVGRAFLKKSFSNSSGLILFSCASLPDEFCDALRCSRAGQHGVDGHVRAGAGLGEAAGDSELRSLGRPVMDHFGGDLEPRFTRDENDPAPVAFFHPAQVSSAQAHPGENIDGEEFLPFRVADLFKRLRLKNADIVDQDVDLGQLPNDFGATFGRAEIGGDSM